MPINYKDYPVDWKQIRDKIVARAKDACELCKAQNHEPHWLTESKVVLTVHHIDCDKKNNHKLNLIVLCQRCRLRLDAYKHWKKRKENREKNKKQMNLELDKIVITN